jgi:hypothetical protein
MPFLRRAGGQPPSKTAEIEAARDRAVIAAPANPPVGFLPPDSGPPNGDEIISTISSASRADARPVPAD